MPHRSHRSHTDHTHTQTHRARERERERERERVLLYGSTRSYKYSPWRTTQPGSSFDSEESVRERVPSGKRERIFKLNMQKRCLQ